MKTVFNTRECAHIWAQQTQPSGRNASRSVRFEGALFYSYGTPIANIIEAVTERGMRVALISSKGYSTTTAGKHLPAARRAVYDLMAVFHVPFIYEHSCGRYRGPPAIGWRAVHEANTAALARAYAARVERLMRARSWCGPNWLFDVQQQLEGIAAIALRYARLFDVPAPNFSIDTDAARIVERRVRIDNDPKRKAKAALAASQAEERRLARERTAALANAQCVATFRAGKYTASCSDAEGMALLRVSSDGTKVETSWGASAPVDDVRRVLSFYQSVRRTEHAWERLGVSPATRLGSFTLDAIDTAGNVRAGCHRISAREVESLAAQLAEPGSIAEVNAAQRRIDARGNK